MHYEKSYKILQFGVPGGLVVTLAGFALYGTFEIPGMVLCYLGTIAMCGSILQAALYFRCPYCGRHFPIRNPKLPKFCPECGKKLGEEQ